MRRFVLRGLAAGLALMSAAAQAQDAVSARAFVARLYAPYHGRGPDYLGRQARATFSPGLLALIRMDRAKTPKGDVPALDGDPICDCQDFEGLKLTDLKITATGQGRASAAIRVRNAGETNAMKLDLVVAGGGWRVNDIHTAGTPSLVAFLREHGGGR